ncbi:MAG TPA: hypothetical protein VMR21_02470 [Vicinamibacteria bacterium]|nr:hypothetical protein [Vicinamibacteria bacterium]
MNRTSALALAAACLLFTAAPRWSQEKQEAGRARISIYSAVPGKQLDLLKWLAAREEVAREAGVPPARLYAHLDGEGWDYLVLWPLTTPEQDRRMDELAAKKGLKTGFASSLEFRALLDRHSDTLAAGPTTAAELVTSASAGR